MRPYCPISTLARTRRRIRVCSSRISASSIPRPTSGMCNHFVVFHNFNCSLSDCPTWRRVHSSSTPCTLLTRFRSTSRSIHPYFISSLIIHIYSSREPVVASVIFYGNGYKTVEDVYLSHSSSKEFEHFLASLGWKVCLFSYFFLSFLLAYFV